jgi:TetR/AcrR family transcriptional repressor of nem operon
VRDRIRRLEGAHTRLAAIRAFFDEVIELLATDPDRRSCVFLNAALEASLDDPLWRGAVTAELVLIESLFRRCVAAGQPGRERRARV